MFMAADLVVKGVMIGLAAASLITWVILVAKLMEIAGAKTRARRALRAVTGAATLNAAAKALKGRRGVGATLLAAAEEEVRLSSDALDHAGGDGLKQRVASRLTRIQAAAGRRLSRGTGILASIGSTAPFVGLFGTVWGIMNAFIGISASQTTNLAVVAPGIAVVVYNVFARSITGYRQTLADAAAGIERLVSRDLDYRAVPAGRG